MNRVFKTDLHRVLKLSSTLLIVTAAIILAVHPINWLIESWVDPSYDSQGEIIFLFVVAILGWSLNSSSHSSNNSNHNKAKIIFVFSTIARFLSQVLSINILGGIALVFDFYAICCFLNIANRKNFASPFWLTALFLFSLPLERVFQRIIGYGMQLISADISGGILSFIFGVVQINGTELIVNGHKILVDMPCSGVKSSLLLLTLMCFLLSIKRLNLKKQIFFISFCFFTAIVCNILRIVFLSSFIASPFLKELIDITKEPFHSLVGLFSIGLGTLIIIKVFHNLKTNKLSNNLNRIRRIFKSENSRKYPRFYVLNFASSVIILCVAIFIINLPKSALDISNTQNYFQLPTYLGNSFAKDIPLKSKEKLYFTQYGGKAEKKAYGKHKLMLIQTTSPLRHLHNPADCLQGLGFAVKYLGYENKLIPTSVFQAEQPNGNNWRVAVTFFSDSGEIVHSVNEAIWHWLKNPNSSWYALQRITPASTNHQEIESWEKQVFRSLDLPDRLKGRPT